MHLQKATTVSQDTIESFRLSLIGKGMSFQTAKAYSSDLKVLLEDTGNQPIPAEQFEDVGEAWLTRYRTIVKPNTTNRRLASLRKFARWAGWGSLFDEYSAPTPLRGQPHPLPEGIPGVRRMIEAANSENHKALVALCGLEGLRIGEALAAQASWFDLQAMTILVTGKGDKQRLVPLAPEAYDVLVRPITRAYCTGEPVVGLNDRFARALITRLGERAKLKRAVSSHDLRATFGTAVYDKTKDLRLVQELLGHANSSTTEIYTGVSMATMREGVVL